MSKVESATTASFVQWCDAAYVPSMNVGTALFHQVLNNVEMAARGSLVQRCAAESVHLIFCRRGILLSSRLCGAVDPSLHENTNGGDQTKWALLRTFGNACGVIFYEDRLHSFL
jgi:hypothetical protein